MDEVALGQLTDWVVGAGLAGKAELAIVNGLCERAVAAGLPLARAHILIDALHPVYEGHLFRWGHDLDVAPTVEYGRTTEIEALVRSGGGVMVDRRIEQRAANVDQWLASPFYRMLQTGESLLRRRLSADTEIEFSVFPDFRAAGLTDYVAIINRFAAEGVIGDMDGVYSSWMSRAPGGFEDAHIAALEGITPFLALAIKSVTLARMTGTLMKTYLGRDAGKRVLSGRIVRGVADHIDAVLWFSDLRGFTRITDTDPQHVIPLLNDYADVIVSAIHEHDGDVLKLIGDGTLAIFTAGERAEASKAALEASIAARRGVATLNARRAACGLPVTDMYLGLHVGEVFYGNVGSTERLDFTVIGPAVNEVSRIAAMCRSVDQPILISDAFAAVGDNRSRLVSVGRYALRGVGRAQELFTLDPGFLA
jgi:adenylate cyclase